ncbi:MAG: UDP-N-acetylmuramoyl-L-alanyl-D-glutamate--2,6-diaminopimelate ligase [Robiginitomaculum sp.]
MTLSELTQKQTYDDVTISGLALDSRAIKPGYLFAAFAGEKVDGCDYIESALARGASAILAMPGLADMPVPYIQSENPRRTFAKMAARFYGVQPRTIVALTGTNGKSSTVEFLRQIWAYAGMKAACFGTLGLTSDKGVKPLTHTTPNSVALHKMLAGLAQDGITHTGMEASSHGLEQYRLDGVQLAAVGFTNLTQDHLDYHADMEDYFKAKARLFTKLAPKGAPAIINIDGEWGQKMTSIARAAGLKIISVGQVGDDIRIAKITPRAASQNINLVWDDIPINLDVPLAGVFQVYNVVTALALAVHTGVLKDIALEAVKHLKGVAGRMEKAGETKDGAPVFIDFAHTPDGLEKLLLGLRPHTKRRIAVVFGCGGDRDADKRPKMGAIADKYADRVIVTDDNPRSELPSKIRKQVLSGCPSAEEIGDREHAIKHGIFRLEKGDCLVIAGKGHESGQIVGDKIIPFSDVAIAQKYLS